MNTPPSSETNPLNNPLLRMRRERRLALLIVVVFAAIGTALNGAKHVLQDWAEPPAQTVSDTSR